MSLLDDVSIVVTPNGYKAGRLYGVLPTATLGSEQVTNGDFATDSDWTKGTGWSIGGGVAISDGSSSYSFLQQTSSVLNSKIYKISYSVTSYTSGSVEVGVGGTSNNNIQRNSVGDFVEYHTSNGTNLTIISRNLIGSIDNVSVKEFTASDMDVTRATAATRVDENGLVNYAEVLGSEIITNGDFATDSGWTIGTGWSISGGKANATDAAFNSQLSDSTNVVAGKVYKISFDVSNYVKGNVRVTVGNVSSSTVSSDGSYTFYLTTSLTTPFRFSTYAGGSGTTLSVDNVSVKESDRNNVPRIDYTGGGCPHILAEPQRTNLITYSEDFSQWTASNMADVTTQRVLASDITSPDGTIGTSYKLTASQVSSRIQISQQTLSQTYTKSIFVKYAGANTTIRLDGSDTNDRIIFDVASSGVTLNTASSNVISHNIESFSNDWYKVSVVLPSGNDYFQVLPDSANGNSYAYFWGAQLEEGSYPTSYIPTSGSTVTRNQDIFTRDGIGSLINDSEGVLFLEMAALSDDGTDRKFSISDGTSSNVISIIYRPTSNQVRGAIVTGGVNQVLLSFVVTDATAFNKIAFKWKAGDFALWIGGVEVVTSSSGSIPTGLNKISNDNGGGSFYINSKVKQLQVYKTALTDAQLTSLTS